MSINKEQPANRNFQSPLNFDFSLTRLPEVNFFVQSVNVPGVTLGIAANTEGTPFSNIPWQGDRLRWEELSITFKLDEDLVNWYAIFSWMVGIGFPETYTQYGELKRGVKRNIDGKELLHRKNPFPKIGDIYSEATLTMLSSNRNPTFQFQFTDCYPIALSELKFDTTDETVNYITVSAAFKYHFYKVYRPE